MKSDIATHANNGAAHDFDGQVQQVAKIILSNRADKYFQENVPNAGLGRASLHSGIIVVAARGVGLMSQVVSIIILARLLTPHDFGLAAIIFSLTSFGPMLIDLGTSESSSQKTSISRAEISTLFWINLMMGVLLACILIALSGPLATFYREPELTGIAIFTSITFIASGLTIQHSALLRRAMQFRSLAAIDICANVISSVLSIAMALTGWGYWALLTKTVCAICVTAIGVWFGCRWLPMRPHYSPEVKKSLRFGMGVTGFLVTDNLAKSADRIALGYFYGASALGYYQNALLFYGNVLGLLADPLHPIAVSSLSKLRNSLNEFRQSWTTALSTLSFVTALIFALLAVAGTDFIVILLGERWAPAGTILCIFAVRGIAQTFERTLGWLHVSSGRSERWMKWGLFSSVCQIAAVLAGLPFGVIGTAITGTIIVYLLFIPGLAYAGRPVGITTTDVVKAVAPQIVAGLAAIALGLLARHFVFHDFNEIVRLVLTGLLCAAVYFLIAVVLFRVTKPLTLALSVISDYTMRLSRNS